jgi:hypothetical protein
MLPVSAPVFWEPGVVWPGRVLVGYAMLPVSFPAGPSGRLNSPELRGSGYAMLPVSGAFWARTVAPTVAKPSATVQPRTRFRIWSSPEESCNVADPATSQRTQRERGRHRANPGGYYRLRHRNTSAGHGYREEAYHDPI